MNDLKWVNKPMIPAIYECPKCGTDIGFIGDGRVKFAREITARTKGMFAISMKPHNCRITRDWNANKKGTKDERRD